MKKILTFTIIALLAVIALSTNVNATDVSSEAEFKEALLGTGSEITLVEDVFLTESLEVGGATNLDLNGFNIRATDSMTDDSLIIVKHGGTLTVTDSSAEKTGKISAKNGAAYIGIKMTKADCDYTKKAILIVDGGTIEGSGFAISGNGNPNRINTEVTINGGKIVSTATDGAGIYHPQDGILTINGGLIQGATGIEMRSGDLTVSGGTIIGTGKPTSVKPNGSGTTTIGAGIAIAQHTTQKEIKVIITEGNVQGYTAVYESNPQNNNTMDKVSVKIEGGNFEAINGGTKAVESENFTDFITGGTFSNDVSEYVSDTLDTVEDENGNVYVGTLHTITIVESENGKVVASLDKAVKGQIVKLTVTPDEGYELESIGYDLGGMGGAIDGTEFEMFDYDVKITAEFKAIEKAEEPELPVEDEKEEVKPVEDEKDEKDEKDETPKTGSIDTILFASAIVAIVSVAGIVTVKKYNK